MSYWGRLIEDNDGVPSSQRIGYLVCIIVMSFILIYLTIEGEMGVEYFIAYGAIVGGVSVWNKQKETEITAKRIDAKVESDSASN